MTDTSPQVRGTLHLPLHDSDGHGTGMYLDAQVSSAAVTFYLGHTEVLAVVALARCANWLLDPHGPLVESRIKLTLDYGHLLVTLDAARVYWVHSDYVADLRAVTGAH